jgi:molecular chaperone HscB
MQDYFQLFGLGRAYALDLDALERAYRDIQSRIHPDRYAHAGDAERRASMQWATRVNEAYRALRGPVTRAKHLLELHGIDVAFETNTAMPAEFLVQQMELREALEGSTRSRDVAALDRLGADIAARKRALEAQLAEAIDARKDYAGGAELVRKLRFLDKLDAEVQAAFETIEAGETGASDAVPPRPH